MKSLLVFVFSLFIFNAFGIDLTIILTAIPANTPQNDQVYISGSFNNWSVGNPNSILTVQSNGTRKIVLQNVSGTIEFKFNRGNWDTPEGTASGGFRPNRTYNTANGSTLNLTIEGWEDLTGNNGSTANANVIILSTNFSIPQLNRTRRIWMYLPNDYATALQKRYPVIYMHDAQNLFDQTTSFSGEWQVDETLSQLQNQGDYGAIVVGIDNGGSTRIDEYSPWVNSEYGGGQGDEYISFIVNTLKPYIDQNYRTLVTAPNTGIMGSSMGGLISLYGVSEFPNVFGKAGIFSPSLWFARNSVQSQISSNNYSNIPLRLYFLGGTNESTSMVSDMQNAKNAFVSSGVSSTNAPIVTHQDGAHSEWYWRREFGAAYQFLFPAPVQETNEVVELSSIEVNLFPNPSVVELQIQSNFEGKMPYYVTFMDGKKILQGTIQNGKHTLSLHYWASGTYLFHFQIEGREIIRKLQIP
ncbi:MAG: hypothetical protein RL264_1717 [Bacteroidota bacterium]|jgi:predicted alpha/beta superfamily hydrolase